MSHGDQVSALPEGWTVTGKTATCPFASVENLEKKYFGLQFHPEVTHTDMGKTILFNFVRTIAGLKGLWNPHNIVDDAVQRIRQQVFFQFTFYYLHRLDPIMLYLVFLVESTVQSRELCLQKLSVIS